MARKELATYPTRLKWRKYGQILLAFQLDAEALKCLEQAVAIDSKDAKSWYYAGIAGRTADQEVAIAAFEKSVTVSADYCPVWVALGRTQFEAGNVRESKKAFEQSVELMPHEAILHLELARVLTAQRKYREAVSILMGAMDLPTAGGDVPEELSNVFALQRDFTAAEHWKERAELFQENSAEIKDPWMHEIFILHQRLRGKLARARELAELKEFAEAEVLCRQILETDPDNVMATVGLGSCLTDAGQWAEAVQILVAASKAHPNEAEVWTILGTAQCAGLNWKDGAGAFRKSLAIEPKAPQISYRLGLALMQLHEPEEAADRIRVYTSTEPDTGQPYFDLGVVLQELKKPLEAVEAFETGILIAPDELHARLSLGQILTTLGDHEAANRHIEHAESLEPDNLSVRSVRQRWFDATRGQPVP
ncbi:MAG: tetratricopeptide repeat protein [Planctomycetes bacterium]|nr:tetratricopeptide repeat protein [Planctomycetota bacterium]